MVATLSPQPARNAAAKTSRTSLRNMGGGGYSPPTLARLPRSMSSSRIDCMRLSAFLRPRLVQPRRRKAASMNLSVISAGSDSVETAPRAATDRMHAGQPPIREVVVGELRVIGDIRQVVEDLLTRPVDHEVSGH